MAPPNDTDLRFLSVIRWLRNPYAFGGFCVAAVALFAIDKPWIALAILVLACIGMVVGLVRTPPEALAEGFTPVAEDPSASVARVASDLGDFETIVFLHLLEGGKFGTHEQFVVKYFLNLMEASLIPGHLDVLVRVLVAYIQGSIGRDLTGLGAIIGPKRGNAILIERVARELGLRCLLVKEKPLFGQWIEGVIPENKSALLVDDISSDGELLTECVERARTEHLEITKAVVLVDRVEGDAATKLSALGVQLLHYVRMSDNDLEELARRGRAGGP